jgi:HK97 family phage portal protein
MMYRTDGYTIKSLGIEDMLGSLDTAAGERDPRAYYRAVPFIRRAVELRANAVAAVPVTLERNGRDVSDRPEWRGLMDQIRSLLWWSEAGVCVSSHGVTWRRAANRAGLNPTPEWLVPHTVTPYITAERGLEYFRYVRPFGVPGAGIVENLPPDQVVYIWLPNLERANYPGPSPAFTALNAASALYNKDQFISGYFARGAMKTVLLQVPADSKASERDRLNAWWRGITNGIANAWRSVVVSAQVNPVVLGDGLKEMNNESLTREYRQEVAAAFGIPETLLMQGAANFATAKTDRISFYEETVFPSVNRIVDAFNRQWLREAYGAELVSHPEQTQERQDAQLTQAEAITSLVGEPVMTVDEGRAWLGFEPLPRPDQPPGGHDADEADDYAAMEADDAEADAAEESAEEIEDDEGDDETKRYARDPAGKYRMLPGAPERTIERQALAQAQRTIRQETRQRHTTERTMARQRFIDERTKATDAKTRLTLVHRQKADVATIRARQRAERVMIRALHQAERSRVLDRHAAQREREIGELARATKARRRSEWDDADEDMARWLVEQDALDLIGDPQRIWEAYDDSDATKKAPKRGKFNPNNHPRDARGRFMGAPGGAQRADERKQLAAEQQKERRITTERQASQRASLTAAHANERRSDRSPETRERQAKERADLRERQAKEREQVRGRQQVARVAIAERHAAAREEEMTAILAQRADATPPKSRTTAFGTDPTKTYELRHRIVDLGDVQVSNLPTGGINPNYDPRLQPRDRSRQASQAQIDAVARKLNPEAVLTDFHQIDKGSPIIDASGNVLSGNGRTLALNRASEINPEVYAAYREQLRSRARELGLDPAAIDGMQRPVLVRELMGDTDPAAFAREANSSGTLRMSPLEQAKVDAGQISNDHMLRFSVKDDQTIDQALRDRANAPWVSEFLSDIPDNERANLLTRNGDLNQMGLYRVKAAIYTRAFPGEAGERMAESMLESLDPSLKNVQTGISSALPALSRVRALIGSGAREADLDITADFAAAVDTLARIKDNPRLDGIPAAQRVNAYLDAVRNSFLDDKPTPDQERILVHLDTISRKPTAVRDLLTDYADLVERQADPAQGDLFAAAPDQAPSRLTRESLLSRLFGPPVLATQGSLF